MLRSGFQGHDALELFAVIAGTRIGASPASLNVAVNACSEWDPQAHVALELLQ